ncbi:MAG: MarR family transcriptional regulator [Alphaproteobacteria bacterium]|nr:MarR family transcriptional regulator [Alphaproteobacteria bacterium]
MVKNLAKKAMTTKGQKACYVIDHLVEALGNEPSSSLRRAMILVDIDQHPGTTQVGIMERLHIHKSAVNREIEWLFNYGCIKMSDSERDGRVKKIEVYGYAKTALDAAMDYFEGNHRNMQLFLEEFSRFLKQEKPTLRDAKIIASLYEMKDAPKQAVIDKLYRGPSSTDNRAFNKLIEEGVIEDA